jgi:DNA-binding SARP family transcriptional activator
MQFRILGPVEVVDGDGPLPLGGPKQRAVLVHLLLRARQTIPTERLIDALWDGAPPMSARASLHSYVSNLRRVVGDDRIPTRGGYVLEVADDEIDARRFEALYEQARATVHTDPAGAIELLDEALALWRGHALEDVADLPGIRPAATRLDELRATARESWVDARMATPRM